MKFLQVSSIRSEIFIDLIFTVTSSYKRPISHFTRYSIKIHVEKKKKHSGRKRDSREEMRWSARRGWDAWIYHHPSKLVPAPMFTHTFTFCGKWEWRRRARGRLNQPKMPRGFWLRGEKERGVKGREGAVRLRKKRWNISLCFSE